MESLLCTNKTNAPKNKNEIHIDNPLHSMDAVANSVLFISSTKLDTVFEARYIFLVLHKQKPDMVI